MKGIAARWTRYALVAAVALGLISIPGPVLRGAAQAEEAAEARFYLQDWESGSGGWVSKFGDEVVLVEDTDAPSPPTAQEISRVTGAGDYFSPFIELYGGQPFCFGASINWIGGGWPFVGFDNYDADETFLGETWVIGSENYAVEYVDGEADTVTPVSESAIGWHRYEKTVFVKSDTAQIKLKDELFESQSKDGENRGLFDDLTIDRGPCDADDTSGDLMRYRFLQFNMTGAVRVEDKYGHEYGHEGDLSWDVFEKIAQTVKRFRPAAFSLNEVCKIQFDYLKLLMDEYSPYPMYGRFATTKRRANKCKGRQGKGEKQYGIAIFIAKPYWEEQALEEHVLRKAAEKRKVACVRADFGVATRVCTTHLADSEDDSLETDQIAVLTDYIDPWIASGEPLVLMGDFNADPKSDALDPLYAASYGGGAEGAFLEVDGFRDRDEPCRCGSGTFLRGRKEKLDYIFLSKGNWSWLSGKVTDTTTESDHRILRGSGVLLSQP